MTEMQTTTEPETQQEQATLLFVDDEANILSALQRLFRPLGYRIFTAESGKAGLEIMANETVDLVVSDMRMPEMTGAQFLEQVRAKWPETVRILLTGYADMESTIDAINKGQIYRYISKPWEDSDITITVRQALERKHLAQEKVRLEALTSKQNEELKELNASLEEKVEARTEELRQAMTSLESAHEQLKKSFVNSIRIFSNLIDMRGGAMAGHSRRVAETARKLAQRLGMIEREVQDVMVAALLHDVGMFGLPDKLISKPFETMNAEERSEVAKHPIHGQAVLMGLEQLRNSAAMIRSHHERFDGMGYPDRLSGLAIPRGAQVLTVANDFDAVQIGTRFVKRMSEEEALAYIKDGKGKRYDPLVADAFLGMMGGVKSEPKSLPEIAEETGQLMVGMTLSRDIVTKGGHLLLTKGYVLTDHLIGQIKDYEKLEGRPFTIYVHVKRS